MSWSQPFDMVVAGPICGYSIYPKYSDSLSVCLSLCWTWPKYFKVDRSDKPQLSQNGENIDGTWAVKKNSVSQLSVGHTRIDNQESFSEANYIKTIADSWMISSLSLALWAQFSADDILKYFSYFSQKTGFDISRKLSPQETICMKWQSLFVWKNKKICNKFFVCLTCPESGIG